MRFLWLVSILLLIATEVDLAEIIPNKNNVLTTEKENAVDDVRNKRDSHNHMRWGQRQVGYFEPSGENISENEFLPQDIRGSGLREDEKFENNADFVQSTLVQEGQNGVGSFPVGADEDIEGSPKFQVVSDDLGPNYRSLRNMRQSRRFVSSSEILKAPDRSEVDTNFINLIKWNKNKEMMPDVFQSRTQKNEAYPVNDDIADFAVFMNKTKKKKVKLGGGTQDINKVEFEDDCERISDYPDFKRIPTDVNLNFGRSFNLPPDKYIIQNNRKVKKDTSNNSDDFLFPCDDLYTWDRNKGNSQSLRHSDYGSVGSSIRGSSVNEAETDQAGISEQLQDISSRVVSDVVRERKINLPEPLVFNSSHVVSSFLYTMIPFKSPLLNLIENDKHSKYIMIKIDPVLQPTNKRTFPFDPQPKSDNIEYTLEKNVMKVIQKLIGSDSQWDLSSIECQPRSKQNYKTLKNRCYLITGNATSAANSSLLKDKIKQFNGVIS